MIDELRMFLTVSTVGSIQAAIQQLPLTQSAVTKQIQRLEQELHCTLLDRSVKPQRLTREGEEVRARGRRLIDDIEEFKASFDTGAEPTGLMRIGIAHAALDWRGSHAIARSVLEVTRTYPKTTVRLSSGWTPHLTDEVISGNLDAALILCKAGAPSPPEVMNYPIASDQLVAVAPRSLGIMKQTGFDELFNSPWVLNPDGCGYRSLLVSHAWSVHKSVHVIAEAQGAGLQRELVVSGLGTGLVPEEVARTWMLRYPDSKAIVIVRPVKKQFAIAAALISTKRASRLRRPIELLGKKLTEAFAARPSKTNRRSSSQGK